MNYQIFKPSLSDLQNICLRIYLVIQNQIIRQHRQAQTVIASSPICHLISQMPTTSNLGQCQMPQSLEGLSHTVEVPIIRAIFCSFHRLIVRKVDLNMNNQGWNWLYHVIKQHYNLCKGQLNSLILQHLSVSNEFYALILLLLCDYFNGKRILNR